MSADDVATLLDEATEAARDPMRAVESLIAAWRLQPAPAIADEIDALARRLPLPPQPIAKRKQWLAVVAAGQLGDIPGLVAALDHDWAPPELARMIAWPLDPRVVRAVAERLVRVPDVDRDRVVARLVEVGDARTVGALARLLGDDAPATRALQARAATTSIVTPAAAAALERYRAARAAHLTAERSLLAAVYAAPDDDEPRLVYGDWLLGHGDPRGEFIALQFRQHRGRMSHVEARREDLLFATYRRAWLDGLDVAAVTPVAYRRGFVDEVAVFQGRDFDPMVVIDPAWATVRAIRIDWLQEVVATRLLDPARLPSLRSLDMRSSSVRWLLDIALLPRLPRVSVQMRSPFEDAPYLAGLLARGRALERVEVETQCLRIALVAGARPRSRLELRVSPRQQASSSRVYASHVTSELFPFLIDALAADALTELVVITPRGKADEDAALDAALAPLLAAQRDLASITYQPPP